MKDLIEKNAQWWADKIASSSPNWDNGDKSKSGGMASMLANLVASKSRENITPEMLGEFKSKLSELMQREFDNGRTEVGLHVDYHPCDLLSQAAAFAKIESLAFPCKTSTYLDIEKQKLRGKIGYGKPMQTI